MKFILQNTFFSSDYLSQIKELTGKLFDDYKKVMTSAQNFSRKRDANIDKVRKLMDKAEKEISSMKKKDPNRSYFAEKEYEKIKEYTKEVNRNMERLAGQISSYL